MLLIIIILRLIWLNLHGLGANSLLKSITLCCVVLWDRSQEYVALDAAHAVLGVCSSGWLEPEANLHLPRTNITGMSHYADWSTGFYQIITITNWYLSRICSSILVSSNHTRFQRLSTIAFPWSAGQVSPSHCLFLSAGDLKSLEWDVVPRTRALSMQQALKLTYEQKWKHLQTTRRFTKEEIKELKREIQWLAWQMSFCLGNLKVTSSAIIRN